MTEDSQEEDNQEEDSQVAALRADARAKHVSFMESDTEDVDSAATTLGGGEADQPIDEAAAVETPTIQHTTEPAPRPVPPVEAPAPTPAPAAEAPAPAPAAEAPAPAALAPAPAALAPAAKASNARFLTFFKLGAPPVPSQDSIVFSQGMTRKSESDPIGSWASSPPPRESRTGVKRKPESDPIGSWDSSPPPRESRIGVKPVRRPLPQTTGAPTEVPETPLPASVGGSSNRVCASTSAASANTGQPSDETQISDSEVY